MKAALFSIGDKVEDSWWNGVCGVVQRVTRSSVYLLVKYRSLVPAGFDMKDGIIRYDKTHARNYLRAVPNL